MNTPSDKDPTRSDNNEPDGDKQFAAQATALFDDSVDRLDAATLSKLNQRRQSALAKAGGAQPGHAWLRWAPASGLAAAAVVAVMMMQGPGVTDIPAMPDTAATDFEILLGDEQLEMIEEREFYSWIDMADEDVFDNVG
ncbi:MAG: hypothetical protein R3288_14600 [Woeseiaceae bacterium]|nr:hypothetical protein [Woeseiaceae bacterium]